MRFEEWPIASRSAQLLLVALLVGAAEAPARGTRSLASAARRRRPNARAIEATLARRARARRRNGIPRAHRAAGRRPRGLERPSGSPRAGGAGSAQVLRPPRRYAHTSSRALRRLATTRCRDPPGATTSLRPGPPQASGHARCAMPSRRRGRDSLVHSKTVVLVCTSYTGSSRNTRSRRSTQWSASPRHWRPTSARRPGNGAAVNRFLRSWSVQVHEPLRRASRSCTVVIPSDPCCPLTAVQCL